MWWWTSSSSNASHSPNVGDPTRRSTITSRICPRAHRTSFDIPVPDLVVEAADHPPARTGVVVLDEGLFDAEAGQLGVVVTLQEEAAVVTVDRRGEQDWSLEARVEAGQTRTG